MQVGEKGEHPYRQLGGGGGTEVPTEGTPVYIPVVVEVAVVVVVVFRQPAGVHTVVVELVVVKHL